MRRLIILLAIAVLIISFEKTANAQPQNQKAEDAQTIRIEKQENRLELTTNNTDGKEETTQFKANSKVKFDAPVGVPRVSIQSKDDKTEQTILLNEDDEVEIEDEESTEAGKIKVNRRGGDFIVENDGVRTRSNFPLTVNPETNELTITTPSGEKTIILPSVAIQNMISKAGFDVVETDDDNNSTESGEIEDNATESGELDTIENSELTLIYDTEGNLLYEAEGIDNQKFLGLFPVGIRKKIQVNAETGAIVAINSPFFQRILDSLSF